MQSNSPENKRKLTLTSVNQLLAIIKANPEIASAIPRMSSLLSVPPSTTPKKSCNCGSKMNIVTPDANKQTAESILSNLTQGDFLTIKNILGYDQLCYYKRENNKLEMVCL